MTLVGNELFQLGRGDLFGGQRLFGDGVDGGPQPIGGQGIGVVERGQRGEQGSRAELNQLLPSGARRLVAGAFAADRLELPKDTA